MLQLPGDPTPTIARLASDADPQVRRECALALHMLKTPGAADIWAKLATAVRRQRPLVPGSAGHWGRRTVGCVLYGLAKNSREKIRLPPPPEKTLCGGRVRRSRYPCWLPWREMLRWILKVACGTSGRLILTQGEPINRRPC